VIGPCDFLDPVGDQLVHLVIVVLMGSRLGAAAPDSCRSITCLTVFGVIPRQA
jgi:hypothetical protein